MNFIESYMNNSFITGDSAFTNQLIAVPIVATIVLLFSNFIRTKLIKHIPNGLFDCKFISIILICYAFIVVAITSLFNCQLSTAIILVLISGYIPFLSLSWCIYKECCLPSDNEKSDDDNSSYAGAFTKKIKRRVQQIRNANKAKNILINGSWGAGKSYFIEKHLIPTQSFIYISCTDYADTHELISALITKTNNCLFRWLVRLSISRLLAVLGKYELKEFIGINQVIVFDEFERLVDYNKIDPMHIVSLIQYLNNQKNCICILVANEDHLNNASQFNNVREKLISYIYRYKVPFDEVISIVKNRYSHLQAVDLENQQFSEIRNSLNKWYQIDNNIRMIEHLYIKINELYQATCQMLRDDGFYKEYFKDKDANKVDELFSGLFSYINTVVIQLYYLYLKNPYFLTVIEKFAGIYHDDTFIKTDEEDKSLEDNKKLKSQHSYFPKKSLQQLARIYTELESYQNYYNQFVSCFKEVQDNEVFAKINEKLIIDYLADLEFVVVFLEPNEITSEGTRQSIEFFIRRFKETVCESDDPKLVINYFKRLNILEERFRELVEKVADKEDTQAKEAFDNSIIIDYIAYCQYINEKWPRGNPNNIRPVSYRQELYLNALMVKYLLQDTEDNETLELLLDKIADFYKVLQNKNKIIAIQNELTIEMAIKGKNIQKYIKLVSHITTRLIESHKQPDDHHILLYFMGNSYSTIKEYLAIQEDIDLCNNEIIKLSISQLKGAQFIGPFFRLFYNFNHMIIESDRNRGYIQNYIINIAKIIDNLAQFYSPELLLKQMTELYAKIKDYLEEADFQSCNKNIINLLNVNNKSRDFMNQVFVELSNFNTDRTTINFPEDSLVYLVHKIKAIFNTQELLSSAIIDIKSFNNQIADDVIDKLEEELNKQNTQETE